MDMKYLLRSLKWKIRNWMYYHSNIYIEFNIFKLWRYWWTARKYFLAPIIVKHKLKVNEGLGSDYFYMKTDNYNKWFHLSFHSCDWKSKFEEVRFEGVPYACLILFNKVKYIWGLEAPLYEQSKEKWSRNNMLYWEGVLSYLIEHNKDLVKTYRNNIWISHYNVQNLKDGTHHPFEIQHTIFQCLTNKGKNIILQYQKNIKE